MSDDAVIVEALVQRPDSAGDGSNSTKATDNLEPSRKRARGDAGDEEKRRGKRMFGSLLGTLGGFKKDASSDKAQERAARQAELAVRQKEKLQKASDDIAIKQAEDKAHEEEIAKQSDALEVRSQAAAKSRYDMQIAQHLSTTCNGVALLYLPWKLTEAQESRIKDRLRVALASQELNPRYAMLSAGIDTSGVVDEHRMNDESQHDQVRTDDSSPTKLPPLSAPEDTPMESASTNEPTNIPIGDSTEPTMTTDRASENIESTVTQNSVQENGETSLLNEAGTNESPSPPPDLPSSLQVESPGAPNNEATSAEAGEETTIDKSAHDSSTQLDTTARLTIPSEDQISTPDINAPFPQEFEEAFDS